MSLSYMHKRRGEAGKSEQCLRKAIDHYFQAHRFYSNECARAHYYLARIYLSEGAEGEDVPRGEEEEGGVEERRLGAAEERGLKELETAVNILSLLNSEDFATFSKVYTAIGETYMRANSLFLAEDQFLYALQRIKDPTGRREKRLAFRPTVGLGRVYRRWRNYADARPYF